MHNSRPWPYYIRSKSAINSSPKRFFIGYYAVIQNMTCSWLCRFLIPFFHPLRNKGKGKCGEQICIQFHSFSGLPRETTELMELYTYIFVPVNKPLNIWKYKTHFCNECIGVLLIELNSITQYKIILVHIEHMYMTNCISLRLWHNLIMASMIMGRELQYVLSDAHSSGSLFHILNPIYVSQLASVIGP